MSDRPILILGGGINGAAVARELALNGASVWLVDTADLAYGATAYSSRLIHGGLRYLEFAEFSLVKESLTERARLLKLAPHLVKPLRLFIPVRNSWGGLAQAAGKFLGLPLKSKKTVHRGSDCGCTIATPKTAACHRGHCMNPARQRTCPPSAPTWLASCGPIPTPKSFIPSGW
jgi:glycerol-3-phosphate dehydrogenase